MAKLLIDESPLIILPTLAKAIGVNEAIVVQQVHYWLERNRQERKHLHDGRYWAFNSIVEWQKTFDFWSVDTVERTFKRLQKIGVLLCGNYNRDRRDRTKWYSIDYEKLESFAECNTADCGNAIPQNAPTHYRNLHQPLPEITTKITTEKEIHSPAEPNIVALVVEYLNKVTGSAYRPGTAKTQTLINARVNEGFGYNNFTQVIDAKAADWLDTDFAKYLRPETLFGTKFESYLNEPGVRKPAQPVLAEPDNFTDNKDEWSGF